jgi:Sec-independent protein translocase protein TatA
MNFLGVGPAEVVVILILMLVVAGPKRMIQWAYQAGRYTATLRKMFQETMDQITREFEDSGIDVRKDIPDLRSKFDIIGEASRVINADLNAQSPSPATPPAEQTSAPATPNINSDSSAQNSPVAGTQDEGDTPRYDAWTPS